jgi:FtsP/CotA-like multicopper oxidase with cupredoxin domain
MGEKGREVNVAPRPMRRANSLSDAPSIQFPPGGGSGSFRKPNSRRLSPPWRQEGAPVVAFDALNPGWWALHCCLLDHLEAGMFAAIRYV